jgi:Rieske Fe-S protein
VEQLARLGVGATVLYMTPAGHRVNITRRAAGETPDDFAALSSVCPHLGCQVHWEPQNNRYFCPCHNGVFSPDGVATGGPPAEAGQRLASYPLKVESGILYIQAPLDALPTGSA